MEETVETTKTFTLGAILNIHAALCSIKGVQDSVFNYFVNQNIVIAETALKGLVKEEQRIKEIIAPFSKQKEALLKEYCVKNKLGEPVITVLPNGSTQYSLDGNEEVYSKALNDLKNTHASIIVEHESALEEFAKLLTTISTTFKPETIDKNSVPNSIPTEIYKGIFPLLT